MVDFFTAKVRKPIERQSEIINVAQAAELKIQTNCAASISVFAMYKIE